MRKYYIILLSLICLDAFGQIFNRAEIMPGIKTVKTKQFSGCGKGYWNIKYYDQKGRMLFQDMYRKNKLLAKHAYTYDDSNNELSFISMYDQNNPGATDTISTSTYEYDQHGGIIKEWCSIGKTMITTERIQISGNETTYRMISKFYWPHKDTFNFDTTDFKLVYNGDQLIEKQIKQDIENGVIEIKEYQYYVDGNLKRRIVSRFPEPEIKPFYVGWPGSDDMSWEYTFDENNRIKELFSIVEGHKYKLEQYEYDEW